MKKNRMMSALIVCACVGALRASPPSVGAAEPDPRVDAITKTAAAFVDAFRNEDAKALAAFWTQDGDYVDLGGRVIKGRKALEDDFADLFKQNDGLQVRIEVASVRFPTADVAIEDGTTSVLASDGSVPNRARYTNVLVKQDGKWLLASVREAPYVPANRRDELQSLEWMIGEWTDQATDGHVAHAVFDWTPDENFIYSVRAVQVKDVYMDNGTQRIGWDPIAKQIRSWNFESDGGFGEGVWTPDGDNKWIIKTTSVVQSGHKITSTNVISRVDADTVTFQVKDQQLDGKPIGDSPVVTMKRMK